MAAAFSFGLVLRPRPTRFVAALFAVVTVSDFLQHAYEAAKAVPERVGATAGR